MKIVIAKIADLSEDPSNARHHPEKNIEAIKSSLREFGQQKPIVATHDGIVRAGNGTLLAAREMGWKHIGVIYSDLEKVDAVRYTIADNRTAELARWDYESLGEQLRAFKDLGDDLQAMGWEEWELGPLLEANWTPDAIDDDQDPSFGIGGDGQEDESERLISLNPEQGRIFDAASDIARRLDPRLEDGQCLELMARAYLQANP